MDDMREYSVDFIVANVRQRPAALRCVTQGADPEVTAQLCDAGAKLASQTLTIVLVALLW